MHKVFKIVLSIVLSFSYLLIPFSVLATALTECFWDSGGDDYSSIYTTTNVWGQTFAVGGSNIEVSEIDLYLWRKGTTGNIKLSLYEYDTDNDEPTGTVLTSKIVNATYDVSYNSTGGFVTGNYWVTFDVPDYELSANTTYVITANISGWSGDVNTNTIRWGRDNNEGYTSGTSVLFNNGLWSEESYDMYFRVYGGTSKQVLVTTQPANWIRIGVTDNFTVNMWSSVYTSPVFSVDNASMHLGLTTNWEYDNYLTLIDSEINQPEGEDFSLSAYQFALVGMVLSANTTYFYQAYAIEDGITYEGQILHFQTDAAGELTIVSIPTLQITKIDNVSNAYGTEYQPVFEITARVTSTLTGVYRKGILFSLTSINSSLSLPIGETRSLDTFSPDGSFMIVLRLGDDPLNLGWNNNQPVYFQAYADNEGGRGFSNIGVLTYNDFNPPSTATPTSQQIIDVSEFVKDTKTSLGLRGIMGSWAFMLLIIGIIALLFGIAFVETQNSMGKTAIGFTWLISSIAVVGGFLFTGELGVWTIVVAAGSVVAIILIFLSIKLSGGGQTI